MDLLYLGAEIDKDCLLADLGYELDIARVIGEEGASEEEMSP